MSNEYFEISLRLASALVIGGLIGLERSFHGRPAGFRTHALVCLASALLMLVTVFEGQWFSTRGLERVSIDPTRLAQGIMTGIGFLGAGVIMKEGTSVRGLTTAASVWMTAGIGILVGIGFYFPAAFATILTLGTLSAFRWVEQRMPSEIFASLTVKSPRESVLPEPQLRSSIKEAGMSLVGLGYRIGEDNNAFEYRATLCTTDRNNFQKLSSALANSPFVKQFEIRPR